jgi:ankyrin repeat protein
VLAFDLSTGGVPKLNADWRWENQEEAVLSACSSLVSVIIEDGSRIVQFSHFSVKEYLTSDRLASCMDTSQFYIPIEPSHVILSQACLCVLLCLDDRTDEGGVHHIPLFRYAVENWVGHVQVGDVKSKSQIKGAMDCFFDIDRPHFSAWLRLCHPHELLAASVYAVPTGVPLSPPGTPLYFAASNGFYDQVECLIIKHSQQVHQLGGVFGTPLHASVHEGHIKVAQLLLAHGADINSLSEDKFTPLHLASSKGHLTNAKWLLDHGADVTSQDARGYTPLHFAAQNGHLKVCHMLLEHNAKVNSCSYHRSTPLLLASESGRTEVVQLLLHFNADVYVCDSYGDNALHCAALGGHPEVARILLKSNPEVNSRNSYGETPLHQASKSGTEGNTEVVRLLLDYGADVQMPSLGGETAFDVAHHRGRHEIVQLLSQHAAE